mmetsp:Transcript_27135/g.58090  ORF Transcript_27135/g.58090 Transcript_27135/m.58090 type:complete len:239 (+) Transcript_27135:3236-3952(+)
MAVGMAVGTTVGRAAGTAVGTAVGTALGTAISASTFSSPASASASCPSSPFSISSLMASSTSSISSLMNFSSSSVSGTTMSISLGSRTSPSFSLLLSDCPCSSRISLLLLSRRFPISCSARSSRVASDGGYSGSPGLLSPSFVPVGSVVAVVSADLGAAVGNLVVPGIFLSKDSASIGPASSASSKSSGRGAISPFSIVKTPSGTGSKISIGTSVVRTLFLSRLASSLCSSMLSSSSM